MGALDGKVAIVTGAGQGVGRCHAEELARHGAAVVVNDLSDRAFDVVAAILADGGTAFAHLSDVADWAGAEGLAARAIQEFGGLDIVVNNAGFLRDAMTVSMTEGQFDPVVDVHLKGHFALSRAAAAYWREQAKALREGEEAGPRRIINTTSEAGLFGGPGQANYAAAKGGIASMTLVMARELERYNVTVNCIAPRARTPMTEVNPKFAKPDTGFDRYDPANVSPMVAWLASDSASDVSGQIFIVLADQIHRVRPTEVASTIRNGDERWTLESLSAAKDALFENANPGVPPWAGPPMLW